MKLDATLARLNADIGYGRPARAGRSGIHSRPSTAATRGWPAPRRGTSSGRPAPSLPGAHPAMTHDPCRHSCCIPPTAREAVERQRESMARRKRDLLEQIKEAQAWAACSSCPTPPGRRRGADQRRAGDPDPGRPAASPVGSGCGFQHDTVLQRQVLGAAAFRASNRSSIASCVIGRRRRLSDATWNAGTTISAGTSNQLPRIRRASSSRLISSSRRRASQHR